MRWQLGKMSRLIDRRERLKAIKMGTDAGRMLEVVV